MPLGCEGSRGGARRALADVFSENAFFSLDSMPSVSQHLHIEDYALDFMGDSECSKQFLQNLAVFEHHI